MQSTGQTTKHASQPVHMSSSSSASTFGNFFLAIGTLILRYVWRGARIAQCRLLPVVRGPLSVEGPTVAIDNGQPTTDNSPFHGIHQQAGLHDLPPQPADAERL